MSERRQDPSDDIAWSAGAGSCVSFAKEPIMKSILNPRAPSFAAKCLLGACAVAVLPACADFHAAGARIAEGWREAVVVQIDRSAQIPQRVFGDCREGTPAQATADTTYVVYRYKGVGSYSYRVAPLPDKLPLKVGDLVSVNIKNCQTPPTPR
jgi:hypothetical protein